MCAVELFVRTGPMMETQGGFRHEINGQEVPSPETIRRWIRQWRAKDSVACKKPPGRSSSVCTTDRNARVLASIGRSPR